MNLGKKVKVRDMQPGWTYRVPDKTLEEIYENKYEYAKWPPAGMSNVIPNTGMLMHRVTEKSKDNWKNKYGFSLYLLQEADELTEKPLKPGQRGTYQVVRTGNKVWMHHPNYTIRVEVDSLDFEMEEAHPFPVAKISDEYGIIPLPNPWNWRRASEIPDSKLTNYVEVWDESDVKTLAVLGVISLLFLLAGPSGWSVLAVIWFAAAAHFHAKHEKIRKDVLEERERNGISGPGLDHKFRW